MPVMDIGHVTVLVLGVRMFVLVCMRDISSVMFMKFIMSVPVFVHDRHMDMKMGVLFICQ